ncbi:MAG: hypothetical protein L0387_44150, partial [Acidobacteria bacterium]|nr:hypothetical protein [Acidobacteriota bacterium]
MAKKPIRLPPELQAPRPQLTSKTLKPIPASIPPPLPWQEDPKLTIYQQRQLRKLVLEKANRQIEALNLYEPLPIQDEFHRCTAPERIIRGSNRSGKTLAACVEVARAVCGSDPYNKYPKENGRWFCVAKDGSQIGQVVWRKLGRPGAFKIIRDRQTGLWRAFRPWDPEDADREREAKPAPALIPKRLIRGIAWENKKLDQPSVVTLATGWELSFFSSLSDPPTGSDVDGANFDEEIEGPTWYPEISA